MSPWLGSKNVINLSVTYPNFSGKKNKIAVLNLSKIQNFLDKKNSEIKDNIDLKILKEKKLINKKFDKLKILATGEIKKNIQIQTTF